MRGAGQKTPKLRREDIQPHTHFQIRFFILPTILQKALPWQNNLGKIKKLVCKWVCGCMSSTQKRDGKFGTVLSSDSRYQSRSIIFLWLKVVKTLSWRFFLAKNAKKKIVVIHFSQSLPKWRLPLLRDTNMWKRSVAKAVLNHLCFSELKKSCMGTTLQSFLIRGP